ncbi:MAG: tyrosine-type recombinase/integrase [Deltaproteobacteria bacterium]|nr:tyrosine-type recombinase/integrase [Deltaproteobacteria bacterium]MBW2087442.1 tyrosine-type recombinase/integrase [Deltaproteobacteria bacterium]
MRNIRLLRYRVCLTTIYSCGLRLSEGTHLKVEDIDGDRGFISIRHSKGHMGNKDRNVPLPVFIGGLCRWGQTLIID